MKIQLVSDLHIEFGDWSPPKTDADVVVLAGDIHNAGRGVEWAINNFNVPVIFTPGNHDYYGESVNSAIKIMRTRARGTHVHVLQDNEVIIDGVRFLGGTLWTDYQLLNNQNMAMSVAQARMNDFVLIGKDDFSNLTPRAVLECHFKTRRFIESRSRAAHPWGKTVVVTHHAPSQLSIDQSKAPNSLSVEPAYASSLDHLMGQHIDLWFHGHIHSNRDYHSNGTRVVCNPRGYDNHKLNPDFIPDLILEI